MSFVVLHKSNMPPEPKVIRTPLEHLPGDTNARRVRLLSKEAIRELLRSGPVEFVIADVVRPLTRIEVCKCYQFWKADVQPHAVENPEEPFRLEDFPDEYAYIASEWSGATKLPIVLLEKHH